MKIEYKKKDVFIQSVMDKRRLCLSRAPINVAQPCKRQGQLLNQHIYIVRFFLSITISFFKFRWMHLFFIEEKQMHLGHKFISFT
jgi:hypothetical protein